MKQKVIQILCILLFFLVYAFFSGREYWNFQQEQNATTENLSFLSENNATFSLDTLTQFSGNTEIFVTPSKKLLDTLVREIEDAQFHVYVEVYILTEKRIQEALIDAHKRGIEVKVLLENNPYQTPYINDASFNLLKENGVDVRWSDPLLYSLNHAKLLIIDDFFYISTGNFSYSLFTKNRDFLVKSYEKELHKMLQEIFFHDFLRQGEIPYHPHLVLSPEYSRNKLEYLLQASEKTIDFYFPYIQDENFEKILFEKAKQGVQIRGIVEEEFYKENIELIQKYEKNGITITPLKKEYLHGKVLLIDNKVVYIGSINFSKFSFDENREIGILVSSEKIITFLGDLFLKDFFGK